MTGKYLKMSLLNRYYRRTNFHSNINVVFRLKINRNKVMKNQTEVAERSE